MYCIYNISTESTNLTLNVYIEGNLDKLSQYNFQDSWNYPASE